MATVVRKSTTDKGFREPCRSTEEAQGLTSYISSVSDKPKCWASYHTRKDRLKRTNLTFPLVLLLCPYLETLRKWLQKFYQKEISEVGGFLYLNGEIWKGKEIIVIKLSILPSLHTTLSNKADFLRNYRLCVSLTSDTCYAYPRSAGEPHKNLQVRYAKFKAHREAEEPGSNAALLPTASVTSPGHSPLGSVSSSTSQGEEPHDHCLLRNHYTSFRLRVFPIPLRCWIACSAGSPPTVSSGVGSSIFLISLH